jgi:hypothetical protein
VYKTPFLAQKAFYQNQPSSQGEQDLISHSEHFEQESKLYSRQLEMAYLPQEVYKKLWQGQSSSSSHQIRICNEQEPSLQDQPSAKKVYYLSIFQIEQRINPLGEYFRKRIHFSKH